MTDELKKHLDKVHKEMLLEIDEHLEILRLDRISRIILDKLMSMNKQFLYNNFNTIIPGFDTPQDMKESLSTLVNILLDDTELFVNETVDNQDMLDRIKDNEVLKNKIKPSYKKSINISGRGKEINSLELLDFINDMEIEQIKQINLTFNLILSRRNKEDALEEVQCFKKTVRAFSLENQLLLEDEILKSFKKETNV